MKNIKPFLQYIRQILWSEKAMMPIMALFFSATFPAEGQPDLSISKTGPLNANPGDEITYVITYANTGTDYANNVIIKDYLPGDTLYTYISSIPRGNYDPLSHTITWTKDSIANLSKLAAGFQRIEVKLRAGIPGNGLTGSEDSYYIFRSLDTLENHATIQSDEIAELSSDTIRTMVDQYCGGTMSNALGDTGIIKSATSSAMYYLLQISNTGNITDKFLLNYNEYTCTGQLFDPLYESFTSLSGADINSTPWLSPGETYTFYFKLVSPPGTNPSKWSCHDIYATSSVCSGSTLTGTTTTEIIGNTNEPIILLSKVDSPDPVEKGDTLQFIIHIFNTGGGDADNLTITETYSPLLTFVSATPAPTSSNNIWALGTLPQDQDTTILIKTVVKNTGPCSGSVINSVLATYVNSKGEAQVPATATTTTTISSFPDLRIDKMTIPDILTAVPGQTIDYKILYENIGSCFATQIKINDDFNQQIAFATNLAGGDTITLPGQITWQIDTLFAGEKDSIFYSLKLKNNTYFNPGTNIAGNTAVILLKEADLNYNNNIDYETVPVYVLPDLAIYKTSSADTVGCGNTITFTLTVHNSGNYHGSSVIISDTIPNGLSIINSSGGVVNGQEITWNIPELGIGQTVSKTISALTSCSSLGVKINSAGVSNDNLDSDYTNNHSSDTIFVKDIMPPWLTCPPNLTVDCTAPDPYSDYGAFQAAGGTASDNQSIITESFYLSGNVATGTCPVLITRTYQIEDVVGLASSCSQLITVQDVTPPTLIAVPSDVTVECDAVPAPASITATDNCDSTPVIEMVEASTKTNSGICSDQNYTLTRTWTVTDDCGNTNTGVQVITVHDSQAPVLSGVPENITVECSSVPVVAAPAAIDKCDITPTITFNQVSSKTNDGTCADQNYTITRTWTAADNCGNTSTETQVITVRDLTAPVFTSVPANVTVGCKNVPLPGDPLAADNCDSQVSLVYNGQIIGTGDCEFTITRSWTATDNCGNSATATQILTVRDVESPTFTSVPQNVTVDCNTIPSTGTPTATDDCNGPVQIVYNGQIQAGTECNYTITRTWTATDLCNHSSTATQVITVRDTEPPVFTAGPPDVSIHCWESAPPVGTVSATDNCDPDVTIVYNGESGSLASCGNHLTRKWTATDNCGNASVYTQTISLVDDVPPQLSCRPTTVYLTQLGKYTLNQYDRQYMVINVSDDCTSAGQITINFEPGYFDCNNALTPAPVNVIATDLCGNSAICQTTVLVLDTIRPVADCTNVTKYLDATGNAFIFPGEINDSEDHSNIPPWGSTFNNVKGGSYDACGISFMSVSKQSFDCTNTGENLVTLTVKDPSGNISTCSSTVTILDNLKPIITCKPATLILDSGGTVTATSQQFYTSASDACGIGSVAVRLNYNCNDVGTNPVTVTAYDVNGNFATCTSTVTVRDTIKPLVVCKDTIDLYLDVSGNGTVNAEDLLEISSDGCTIDTVVIGKKTFSVSDPEFNIVQVSVYDPSDNFSSCSVVVQVLDTISPIVICKDTSLYLNESGLISVKAIDLNIRNYDAAGIQSLEISKDTFRCIDIGNNVVTLTAIDKNGNSASCESQVTVLDSIPPELICPADITVVSETGTCTISVAVPAPTVSDNCSYTLMNDFNNTNNASGNYNAGKTIVKWTVTDIAGNVSSCTQQVTVKTPPVALNDQYTTAENVQLKFIPISNDYDCDEPGTIPAISVTKAPVHGKIDQININTGEFTYIPVYRYFGKDSLNYKICDKENQCTEARIIINITKVNDPPEAVNDTILAGCRIVTGNVILNDSDPDADKIVPVKLISGTAHGTLTLNPDGTFTYLPDYRYVGTDQFTYEICDNDPVPLCSTAKGIITVMADTDCDGIFNITDIDDDNDGILDTEEGISADFDNDGIPNSLDIDSDNDGIVDNIEGQPTQGYIPPDWKDTDKDGLIDSYDPDNGGKRFTLVDTDSDGKPDYIDPDSDNDGVPDLIEGFDDNSDGYADLLPSGADKDKDGLDNNFDDTDGAGSADNPIGSYASLQDFDNDGIHDWRDPDDDNDGKPTLSEDLNKDGKFFNDDNDRDLQPDYLDLHDECPLHVPNGFSPDGDGINDYFIVKCIHNYPNAKMIVFNRWGNRVFEKDNYGNTEIWGDGEAWWDGSSSHDWTVGKNKLPSTTYVYILDLKDGSKPITGTVFLNR